MPERERRGVGRVDYSPGAQLRAHIDREVMGKVSQSAFDTPDVSYLCQRHVRIQSWSRAW